jgi:isochorismate synthase EntC
VVTTEDLLGALGKGVARGRRTLVSVTREVGAVDPCATVFASRLASDRWFCWEQPDRGFALAGLGVAHEAASRGPERFRQVADECLRLGGDAVLEAPRELPAAAGPVWLGGFAFGAEGAATSAWSSFAPASLVLPEASICRRGGRSFLTFNAVVRPGEDPEQLEERLASRLAGLRLEAALPLLDPHPTAHAGIRSARPPREFESAVEGATARIAAGELKKVVLAREVIVTAASAHDPAALFGAMREQFPACFCF